MYNYQGAVDHNLRRLQLEPYTIMKTTIGPEPYGNIRIKTLV